MQRWGDTLALSFVFVLLIMASAVRAQAPVAGPMPWLCDVDGVCETGKDCIWMPDVAPTSFFVFPLQWGFDEEALRLMKFEGLRGKPIVATQFASLEEAKSWVFANGLRLNIGAVTAPSVHVADAHGFSVYDVQCFGTGKCRLSSTSVLISCSSA